MEQVVKNLMKHFLDREVQIHINEHLIHRGELVFAKEKDIYLTIVLRKKHGTKGIPIHIPYPFEIELNETQVVFNYD